MPLKDEIGAGTPTKTAIQQFLRYSQQRLANNTKRLYRDNLWRFCDAMPDFVDNICPENIDRFLTSLDMCNNSRNTVLISIRSFYKYLEDFYEFPNIANKVKNLPTQPPRQRVISEIEYSKLLEVAKPKERAIITFLAHSGLRVQEFCDLTPNCISADKTYMTFTGKGGRRRVVPLNNSCRSCIPLIFSKKFNRDQISWICKKLSKKASIPLFYPHAFRHYFITELIKRGVPIAIVSKIAGHSSPVITMSVYCHLLVPDFIGATDCLDSVVTE